MPRMPGLPKGVPSARTSLPASRQAVGIFKSALSGRADSGSASPTGAIAKSSNSRTRGRRAYPEAVQATNFARQRCLLREQSHGEPMGG